MPQQQNRKKNRFIKMLLNWLNTVKEDNDILITSGGDWNCVQSKEKDARGISSANVLKFYFKKFKKTLQFGRSLETFTSGQDTIYMEASVYQRRYAI